MGGAIIAALCVGRGPTPGPSPEGEGGRKVPTPDPSRKREGGGVLYFILNFGLARMRFGLLGRMPVPLVG